MFDMLICTAAYMVAVFSAGSEITQQTLQQARQYFLSSSTNNENITPDQEFKISLLQGNYLRCVELIQKEKTVPTKEHLDMAAKLASIELNSVAKQQAQACVRFIYHDLVDRGILNPDRNTTRNIDQILAEIQRDASGVQGAFIGAIQANDISRMRLFLAQGAQPNLSSNYMKPAEHAIARGHKEALDLLYAAGVQPTIADLQRARINLFLLDSNKKSPYSDILFTQTTQQAGYEQQLRRYQGLCDFIASKLPSEPTTGW